MRRFMWIFAAIGLGALALAGAGQFLLAWPDGVVGMWTGIGAGYLLGAAMFLLMPRWWRSHCDDMYAQAAGRRYLAALWPAMVVYSLTLFASIYLIRRGIESVPLRAVVAVLPVLPIGWVMLAALRYLREVDELQRRIETEAIGAASLLVSLLYFAGGMLQKAEVFDLDAGIAMIWVFPLLCATYGIAKMILTRRYL
jgi:predicted DCC family thiol-disulfide oxidoreductase YuxK